MLRLLKELLFSDPVESMQQRLRRQPLMREFWASEDHALRSIFDQLNNPELNAKVAALSERDFNERLASGEIPAGQTDQYKDLCDRNARRTVWNSPVDLQAELAHLYADLWVEEMRVLGVYDEFQKQYVVDGKSRLVNTYPDEPYF